MRFPTLLFISFLVFSCQPKQQEYTYSTQVLVIGGGTSGIAAAIQAARNGAEVILVEETSWLGGMLTSAGVSATDGNHRLPSGLWGEFRQHIYDYYGGPDSVFTGWVSNTQFEPSVGNDIWHKMAAELANLKLVKGYRVVAVDKEGSKVIGAHFVNEKGEEISIKAHITIEATELGDVIHLAGADYFTGMDTPEEPHNDYVQDLTYAAILQDYGPDADMTIPKPEGYDPAEFHCYCREICEEDTASQVLPCEQVHNYARLPRNKMLLNWPTNGNDYYVNAIPLSHEERQAEYAKAKAHTLNHIYFIQTVVGYKHLGLAENEFPTEDKLPLIPYHRESRRVDGLYQLKVDDMQNPYDHPTVYQHAISVGDYPLDHHHKKNPEGLKETFPPVPSFSVPYECLVSKTIDGLLVAEKSISVTHMVNGATRLQPCVIQLGQAAGAAAAICVQNDIQPRDLDVAQLQSKLLDANCWLLPFLDITPDDSFFRAVQLAGVKGALIGHGIPYQWANQTWIYPDSAVSGSDISQAIKMLELKAPSSIDQGILSRQEAMQILYAIAKQEELSLETVWNTALNNGLLWQTSGNIDPTASISRKEFAWMLMQLFYPEA